MLPYGVTWEQWVLINKHNQNCTCDTGFVPCQLHCPQPGLKQGYEHRNADVGHYRAYIFGKHASSDFISRLHQITQSSYASDYKSHL